MDLGKKIAILMLLVTIGISIKMIIDTQIDLSAQPEVAGSSSSWLYRRAIWIENENPFTLREERVKLVINTKELISSGKLLPNCNDIRFLDDDNATPLKYIIAEEVGEYGEFNQTLTEYEDIVDGCGKEDTIIWVDIPIIEAGGKTIYFLYGNNWANKPDFRTN